MSRLALAPLLLSWMAWSADALGARGVLLSQRTPLGPARSALAGLRCKEEPAAEPAAADSGDLLGGLISREQNPYVTSKAERLRAKYGDSVVEGRSSRSGGREATKKQTEDKRLSQTENNRLALSHVLFLFHMARARPPFFLSPTCVCVCRDSRRGSRKTSPSSNRTTASTASSWAWARLGASTLLRRRQKKTRHGAKVFI